MIVSEARREANRRNALRSTGPKTMEGKARSRLNALTHGLTAEVVYCQEDDLALRELSIEGHGSLASVTPSRRWLAEQVAVLTSRIDRCGRVEQAIRDRARQEATQHWDEARLLEAAELGASINRQPDLVVQRLGQTPQGCQWMLRRWEGLAGEADRAGVWTKEQVEMAFDLLGTPHALREGEILDQLAWNEPVPEASRTLGDLARDHASRLEARRRRLEPLDLRERRDAESGDLDEPARELRNLRRYEASLFKRLRWCLDQTEDEPARSFDPCRAKAEMRSRSQPTPPAPSVVAAPEPVARPEASSEPLDGRATEATPVSRTQRGEAPEPPSTRQDKNARKVEARREAKLRKLERRRA